MTKKHYKHFVSMINRHRYRHDYKRDYIDYPDFTAELCEYFRLDNPRFNETKFREALEKWSCAA